MRAKLLARDDPLAPTLLTPDLKTDKLTQELSILFMSLNIWEVT